MKHGFLISFHNNFKQLKLLIEYLDWENAVIVLGMDKKFYSEEVEKTLKQAVKKATVVFMKLKINWGGSSQIFSTLDMLAEIGKYNCDYVHFLSGTDIPMMTKEYFEDFFEKHNGMNFIEYVKAGYVDAKMKCEYFHFFVENKIYRKFKLLRIISHSLVKIQKILKIKRNFGELYHGSAYFSITNELLGYIEKNAMKIKKQYRYTLAADEVWLQTLVKSSKFIDTVYHFEEKNSNLRYIDWKRRNGNSPYLFTISDLEELKGIINTKYTFSRKFDENVDNKIIDRVYEQLKTEGNIYD